MAARWFDRVPARVHFFAILGLLLALAALWRWVAPARDGFIDPYLWGPTVRDEGYNLASTAFLVLLATLLLLWFLRLLQAYGEHLDLGLALAILPFNAWGAGLRVLEDADLFTPFSEDVATAAPGLPVTSPCVPEVAGGFLHDCFGVLLVSPPIWIWGCLLIYVFARTALIAERAGDRHGPSRALLVYGLSLVTAAAAYVALWAADPPFVRFVAPPWVALVGLASAFALAYGHVRRDGRFEWRRGLLGYATVPVIVVAYYVAVWMTGGRDGWTPTRPQHPEVLVAMLLVPILLGVAVWVQAKALGQPSKRKSTAARPFGVLLYLLLIEAATVLAAFVMMLRAESFAAKIAWAVVGPLAVLAGLGLARTAGHGWGTHPSLLRFADPFSVLLVASQALDAAMTAISIDVYGAGEKHVMANTLMDAVRALHLPAPLSDHTATLAMIGYKIPVALFVIWLLDTYVAGPTARRRDLVLLVKMGAVGVGMVPGIRDGLRLAMGT